MDTNYAPQHQLQPQPQPPKKSPVVAILLIIAILLITCAAFFTGIFIGGHKKTSDRLEGRGYDTAEDAMKAFADAFAAKDVDGMFAACAVESYVDHYDYSEFHKMAGGYNPLQRHFTGSDEASRRIDFEIRRNDLTLDFYNIFLNVSVDEDSPLLSGIMISEDDVSTKSIVKMLKGPEIVDDIEVEEIFGAKRFADLSKVKKAISIREDVYGGEIESLAAELTIDGEDWVLFADVIEYDGKWYILRTNGMGGSLVGATATSGGVVRRDELGY